MNSDMIFQRELAASLNKYAKRVAISASGENYTYEDVDKNSNVILNKLKEQTLEKHAQVILMLNPIDLIFAMTACLKGGYVFVPFDTAYPLERLKRMFETIDGAVIIADEKNNLAAQEIVNGKSVARIVLEEGFYSSSQFPFEFHEEDFDNEDPNYIFYTSGSTGTPKAIVGKNKSLLHFVQWEIETFSLDCSARISQLTTPCHDPILRDVYSAFLCGGAVCIPESKGILLDSTKLANWVEAEKITMIHCTPSLFKAMTDTELSDYSFASLQYILMAGEKINPKALEKWYQVFDGRIKCVNLYGSTETTMVKAYYIIKPEDTKKASIPIGMPMKGAKFIILDENMQICAKGQIGEIYIRTPYCSLGYYNQELNQTIFVKNPFSNQEGDYLFKTGDLGKVLENGNYEFHGRIDRQIKVRGIRVELGEIETILSSYESITDCAVFAKQSKGGDNYEIVAFYTAQSDIDGNLIRNYMASKMNDNILPSSYMRLETLPRLKNGKIDYKTLEEYEVEEKTEIKEPETKTERELLEIWKDILQKDNIGVNQNFLQIGGHSLLIMTMITRISRTFGVEISLGEIFQGATIEKLAQIIHGKKQEECVSSVSKAEEKEFYIVSNSQARMYALWERNPESTVYNMPAGYWVKGKLVTEKLESAIQTIIQRHEILRTAFLVKEGEIVQKVLEKIEFKIQKRTITKQELKKALSEFVQPFQLNKPPLLRCEILTIVGGGTLFLIDFQHIIGDAVSMEIFIHELVSSYQGITLEDTEFQYKDYCEWVNRYKGSEEYGEQEKFWLDLFREEPASLNFPTDFPRSIYNSDKGEIYHVDFGENLSNQIMNFARKESITPNIIFLSSFLSLLYRYTGQNNIVIGTVVAGRTKTEEEKIIGPFINTLALCNELDGDMTFLDVLKNVKRSFVAAYQNQVYPFDELVAKLGRKTEDGSNPLFDIVYDYQNEIKHEIAIEDIVFEPIVVESDTVKFDLCIHISEIRGRFSIGLEYRSSLFRKSTIKRFINQLADLMKAELDNPSAQIAYANIITKEENEVIKQANCCSGNESFSTIDAMFEGCVKNNPNLDALSYEEDTMKQMSYQTLDFISNQIAQYLHNKGIKIGSVVGIMMDNAANAVTAIMGVLKSGATFLPIGIGYYPDDFVKEIIIDSQMDLLFVEDIEKYQGILPEEKESKVQLVEWIQGENEWSNNSGEPAHTVHDMNSIAYIIYTSGTTGKPKGVPIFHKGITNLMSYIKETINIEEKSRMLQFSSVSFDMSVWEIFLALLNGNTLCIFNRKLGTENLYEFLKKERINVATLTPSVLKVLDSDNLIDLKVVISAGEKCTFELLEKWNQNRIFVNAYGPTETTICATLNVVNDQNPNNIGKPVRNMICFILDENGMKCPIGVPGELYIGGIGLAGGYYNHPELTKEKFVHVQEENGECLYKSGDLAKWTEDGDIEILGRKDEQVKIRGFRVETEFINKKICTLSGLDTAVVLENDGQLYGFVVTKEQVDMGILRKKLEKELPSYMIPAKLVQIEKLPLSKGGKINKEELLKVVEGKNETSEEPTGKPQTKTEKLLAAVWQEVLKRDNISIDEVFFEIGGHSLNAIQVVSKAKDAGVMISVADMFRLKTIRNLCDKIESER
jgi:amino acid adenylation domain-containing protein